MLISRRAAFVRNLAVAVVNGAISLAILLIAPLGLASVVTNTFLIAVASFFTAQMADRVVLFLQGDRVEVEQLRRSSYAQPPQMVEQTHPTDLLDPKDRS